MIVQFHDCTIVQTNCTVETFGILPKSGYTLLTTMWFTI